jgi:putative ATP-dependent endonuclease of the OLD family
MAGRSTLSATSVHLTVRLAMKISSITLKNFRCFGEDPVTVDLTDMTTFIGTNGSGKTTILQALSKLFGVSSTERRLERGDFHVPAGRRADQIDKVSLFIEAKLIFPELQADGSFDNAVPAYFQHMVVEEERGDPFCRIRLEGTWVRNNLSEGDIESKLYWVRTGAETIAEDDRLPLQPHERARIHVLYVPASRDPSKQLRNVSGTMLARLVEAVKWSGSPRSTIEEVSDRVKTVFDEEPGLELIHSKIQEHWASLYDSPVYAEPRLQFFAGRFEHVLKQVEMVFGPSEHQREQGIDGLSDGLRSLFTSP